MSSQAKIAANRANGRKSRGPRTRAGKAKASRNAFRHGLAGRSTNPELLAEIAVVVREICGGVIREGVNDPLLYEQAVIIAETGFVRRCIETEHIATIERHRGASVTPLASGDLGFKRARATLLRRKLTYAALMKKDVHAAVSSGPPIPGKCHPGSAAERERVPSEHAGPCKPAAERSEFDALHAAMSDLMRLERYRRRAFSRERRAIRRFYKLEWAAKGD